MQLVEESFIEKFQ